MNYKTWLWVFIINFVFIDFIRRFYQGNPLLLLSLDANLFLIYGAFLLGHSGKVPAKFLPEPVMWALGALIAVVIVQIFNPKWLDLATTMAGIRTYLVPIPMFMIGAHIARTWDHNNYKNAYRFFLGLVFITILFAAVQYRADVAYTTGDWSNPLSPAEHAAHSYGGQMVRLTSSFFASSKRFGKFLVITALILWALSAGFLRNRKHVSFWPGVFILISAGIVISGARESLVIFVGVFGLIWLVFGRIPHVIRRVTILALIIISIVLLIFAIFIYQYQSLSTYKTYNQEYSRFDFLLTSPVDYLNRISGAITIIMIDINNPSVWTGNGLGKYGQETSLSAAIQTQQDSFLEDIYDYTHARGAPGDAGLTKIIVELGMVGLVAFLFLSGIVSLYLWMFYKMTLKTKDAPLFASLLIVLACFIYFLKAHVTLSDQGIMVLFWLAFGYGFARYRIISQQMAILQSTAHPQNFEAARP